MFPLSWATHKGFILPYEERLGLRILGCRTLVIFQYGNVLCPRLSHSLTSWLYFSALSGFQDDFPRRSSFPGNNHSAQCLIAKELQASFYSYTGCQHEHVVCLFGVRCSLTFSASKAIQLQRLCRALNETYYWFFMEYCVKGRWSRIITLISHEDHNLGHKVSTGLKEILDEPIVNS